MIQSLDRGLQILFIMSEKRSVGVTEIAEKLQVNKSTAFRLLKTLEGRNFVAKDEVTDKYRLGIGILNISERLVNNLDIIAISKPYLYELVKITQESAHLCVFSSDKVFTIDQVKTSETMKVSATIGREEPLYCSAAGKCLMAFSSDEERNKILSKIELKPYTTKTIQSLNILKKQFEMICKLGYAVDDEELSIGVRCIAAPIYNNMGIVVNCLGISGPLVRMRDENIEEYVNKVKKIANIISARLGYKV